MQDERFTVGVDVPLPSLGKPYGDAIADGMVRVAPMRTSEEKLIAGMRRGPSGIPVINSIIERCVRLNGVKPVDLLVGDQLFLMMMIRATSYGQDYTFMAKCDSCSQNNQVTKNIPDDFKVYYLDDSFVEPFNVILPLSKAEIGLRLLRVSDEIQIERFQDQSYRKGVVDNGNSGDPSYSYRLACNIVSIKSENGVIDNTGLKHITAINTWIDSLYARDAAAIRQQVLDHDCGLDIEVKFSCSRCGDESGVMLPMTPDFFRTGDRRRTARHNEGAD